MNTSNTATVDSNFLFPQRSELILSFVLLAILVVLLIPLPTFLLDMLLATNIGLTILLLLVTLSAKEPLEFSVFPSLLLLMTLFRLSLNVATTRLILLSANAGHIVSAFGGFVVGGNLVVGLVIFLILVVIQFVVITKGAGRISEVAARFTLDAMPGKQMAIDAELSAGAISEEEARKRRQHLMREAEFYGAMDGASKFVRGDAIAGLIITGVNLIGGVIMALGRGMSISEAIKTYSVLTVGDGLVSQIPALIVATAAGILVTKAASQTSLGQEISSQVLATPGPLAIGAIILLALGLAPGLPLVPFVILAAAVWLASQRMRTRPSARSQPAAEGAKQAPARIPIEVQAEELLQMDRLCVEIGTRLIALVESKKSPNLLDRVTGLRRDLARKHGIWVPPVRIRDNLNLEPESYRILVVGREVGRGQLKVDRLLAIHPKGATPTFEAEPTQDPAFGMPAWWIKETERQRAELLGFTVVDAPTTLVTHLGEIARKHAHELLGREELKMLVDKIKQTNPSVVEELIPNQLTMGALHRVVLLLLEERVPVSDLVRILESLGHLAGQIKDPVELAERVRVDLGRAICDRFRDASGRLRVIVFDPRLEAELRRSVQNGQVVIEPSRLEKLLVKLANEWKKSVAANQEVALLVDTSIRRPLRHILARAINELAVLAYQEIPQDMSLEIAGVIRPEDVIGSATNRTPVGPGN